jgi:hypothetical protein
MKNLLTDTMIQALSVNKKLLDVQVQKQMLTSDTSFPVEKGLIQRGYAVRGERGRVYLTQKGLLASRFINEIRRGNVDRALEYLMDAFDELQVQDATKRKPFKPSLTFKETPKSKIVFDDDEEEV